MGRDKSAFTMHFWRGLLTAVAMIALATSSQAETRVALVIGNALYEHAPHLKNPANDADAIAASLKRADFDVDERKNLTFDAMRLAILEFSRKAREADVAVVYYAGHGIQADGVNYLIPVDAALAGPGSLSVEAVQADTVLGTLAQARRLRLLILDACRDNPFKAELEASGTRDVGSRGLAAISDSGESDTIVAYSAKENTVALDGEGANSPYAEALSRRIDEQGTSIDTMFGEVRDDVLKATNRRQVPFVYSSHGGNVFYFMPGATVVNTTIQVAPGPDPKALDLAAWDGVKDSSDPSVLQTYLDQYPNGTFAKIARAKIAALERASRPAPRTEEASLSPPSQPRPKDTTGGCLVASTAPAGCTFRDCDDVCPEMVVIPPGSFMMGSPASERGRSDTEGPQHSVSIDYRLGVGKYPITFEQWDACVLAGGCAQYHPEDNGWGRGNRPVINMNWSDAQSYVQWLSQKTGQSYRLLSESEYEYAARAGTRTAYYWGNSIGLGHANCFGCGSQWDNKRTSPVGSFSPNRFGLYDILGNMWEWTGDCYYNNYNGAPSDGAAWQSGDCGQHVLRGGSWNKYPQFVRSADRDGNSSSSRSNGGDDIGFRVARTF